MRVDELAGRLTAVVDALAARGATEVVLACNAASTVVGRLGATAIPVEGIIEYGIASVPDELTGQVGVVGGRVVPHRRRSLPARAGPDEGAWCCQRAAQPLSAHIEAGRTGSPEFRNDLGKILAPLRRVDALVLACTHYPAASEWFAAALPHALLIDPVEQLAPRSPSATRTPAAHTTRHARVSSPPATQKQCSTVRPTRGALH